LKNILLKNNMGEKMDNIGKIAYNAYKEIIDNTPPKTEITLSTWEKLPNRIKEAWNAAALKVYNFQK